jgi:hypothetical protein
VVNSPGIDQIAAQISGGASFGPAAEELPPGPVADLDPDQEDEDAAAGGFAAMISAFASLRRSVDAMNASMAREAAWRDRQRRAIRQVPIQPQQIPLTGGAGTLDVPDAYMLAKTGYTASIRRLACWGFTAGTVNIYLEAAAGELCIPFAQAGVATFGRGEQLMAPGERIVFVASGITGYVQIGGKYDLFESWYEPYYIG